MQQGSLTLEERNLILLSQGYRESRKKPYLFFKKVAAETNSNSHLVTFFADMRVTETARRMQTDLPLFYSQPTNGIPNWLEYRLVQKEIEHLMSSGLAPTLYCGRGISVPCEEVRDFLLEDGYCKSCGIDFQAEGPCCEKCRKAELQRSISSLPVCQIPWCETRVSSGHIHGRYHLRFSEDEVRSANADHGFPKVLSGVNHHTVYKTDETMLVCASCHGIINQQRDDRYAPYWELDLRKRSRKTKDAICKTCGAKTRVPIDSDETRCYKCRRNIERRAASAFGRERRSRSPRFYWETGGYTPEGAIRDKFS